MEQIFDKTTTCCFTGHRNIPFDIYPDIKKRLTAAVTQLLSAGVNTFISGGALGFDTMAAKTVLDLKQTHPEISLVMVLPCRDQHARWQARQKAEYEEILKVSDSVYCLNEKYCTGCMHQRNKFIVNQSGYCISYCTKTTGGTAYTVNFANEQGVKVLNLASF